MTTDAIRFKRVANNLFNSLDKLIKAVPSCEVHEVGTWKDCAKCSALEDARAGLEIAKALGVSGSRS